MERLDRDKALSCFSTTKVNCVIGKRNETAGNGKRIGSKRERKTNGRREMDEKEGTSEELGGQGAENYLRKNQHRNKQGKAKQQQKEIGKTTAGKIPYSC